MRKKYFYNNFAFPQIHPEDGNPRITNNFEQSRELQPQDYRWIDESHTAYELTNPDSWGGYKEGRKFGNKWYWKKSDNTWVDENGQNVGLVPWVPKSMQNFLFTNNRSNETHDNQKEDKTFLDYIWDTAKAVTANIIENKYHQFYNDNDDSNQFYTKPERIRSQDALAAGFPPPVGPLLEFFNVANDSPAKYFVRDLHTNAVDKTPFPFALGVPGFLTTLERPTYTERDLSPAQLYYLDKTVRHVAKRLNLNANSFNNTDTIPFSITADDIRNTSNDGLYGDVKQSIIDKNFNPAEQVEHIIGRASGYFTKDNYGIKDSYDFNKNSGNGVDDNAYGTIRTIAKYFGHNDEDPDFQKQHFNIKRDIIWQQ